MNLCGERGREGGREGERARTSLKRFFTRYQAVSGVKGLYTSKTAPLGATTSEKSHDHQTQFLSHTLLFQNYFNFHFIRNVVVVSNK